MTDTAGTIKLVKEAGYGFITPSDGSADWYFHCSSYQGDGDPVAGEKVKFEEGKGRDGRRCAVNVRPVETKPAWAEQSRAEDAPWWAQ